MRILLVDGNPGDLAALRQELAGLGHEVVAAASGGEALRLLALNSLDVIVSEIDLPDLDGFALARAARELGGGRWRPVIFMARHRDSLPALALAAGADGYVVKPVQGKALDVRLRVLEELLGIQHQAIEHTAMLDRHRIALAEEAGVAMHLIHRLVDADKLQDPALRHWVAPAANFKGDFVAAARTPGNILHILLADGVGQGLAASINALPIVAPFYRMTEKGFGIDAIVREMNTKVREFLPPNSFVAVTAAAIDMRESYVRVWNGGNPPPLMIGANGLPGQVFEQNHLALGILDGAELDTATETHAFESGAELMMYTDGLIKAANAEGRLLEKAELLAPLRGSSVDARMDLLKCAVSAHLAATPAADDIAIVLTRCVREVVALENLPPPEKLEAAPPGDDSWRFSLRLMAAEIRRLDVVPMLLGLTHHFEGARDRANELFVILSELFNNALDHGLLGLDSSEKLQPGGMENYLAQRASRLAALTEGEIEINMERFEHGSGSWLRIACRDTGPGFDHAKLQSDNSNPGEKPFGRGLGLVRSLSDSVEFSGSGNQVAAVLALGRLNP